MSDFIWKLVHVQEDRDQQIGPRATDLPRVVTAERNRNVALMLGTDIKTRVVCTDIQV